MEKITEDKFLEVERYLEKLLLLSIHAKVVENIKRMPSFTQLFLDFTKEYESPTNFWKWGSYACLAAIMRDNVYWMQGSRKVCPNIWVLLLADSAVHRKSGPIIEVSKLMNEVKVTKLIRGRSSVQAILDDLAATTTDKQTGGLIRGGSCLLCADELASFFVADPALLALLTDIYDFREEWTSSLKSGKFKIHNLCVTMLAASNETYLKKVYTDEAVFGGLLGRTFMIKPDEYRVANSLLNSDNTKYDIKPMINNLKEIAKVKGEVRFNEDAKLVYDSWYNALRNSYKSKPDKSGVIQRMHTGVIKLAVILSVSTTLSLAINKESIEMAIDDCTGILDNYEAYAMGAGKSAEAHAGSLFLAELWEKEKVTRKDILRKFWSEFSAEVFDKLITTLDQAGLIKMSVDSSGQTFMLSDRGREIFERKK